MTVPSSSSSPASYPVGLFATKILKGDGGDYPFGGPLDLVYGNSKDNKFFGSSASRKPVAFVGGKNSDSYRFTPGQLGIVADSLGGYADTLDFTKIDRAAALWGKVTIGNDIVLSDVVSGMTILIHDWAGVENPNNKIEFVKAQYRDPMTQLVNPRRSQTLALADWVAGALPLPGASFADYKQYNAALEGFRAADGVGQLLPGLAAQLTQLGAQYVPLAPAVRNVILSLPMTTELGIAAGEVPQAWANIAANAGLFS